MFVLSEGTYVRTVLKLFSECITVCNHVEMVQIPKPNPNSNCNAKTMHYVQCSYYFPTGESKEILTLYANFDPGSGLCLLIKKLCCVVVGGCPLSFLCKLAEM